MRRSRKLKCAWFCLALALAATRSAHAAPQVRILETEPASAATLAPNASFYLRLSYQTEEPLRLWARPYRHGVQVPRALTNASPEYLGTGEALGWFAISGSGVVDEVRIVASRGEAEHEWVVAKRAVQLRWDGAAPATAQPKAAWIVRLLHDQQQLLQRTADSSRTGSDVRGASALLGAFVVLVAALVIAGLALPLHAVWQWRGAWRLAAALPVGLIGSVVARVLVDVARDPKSHNLWPFEVLQAAVIALAGVAVLSLVRWLRH